MNYQLSRIGIFFGLICMLIGCAAHTPYSTSHDKTGKGAAIGAGIGALFSIIDGKKEADEILARMAIGAVAGAGIGAYMDAQEEKLARIPGTTVERLDEDTLLVRFDSDVLFETNSYSLGENSMGTLSQASSVFEQYPKTAVIIQGHTDSRGSEDYNQKLSENRAKAVYDFFQKKGVNQERLMAVGYGEGVPVATNDNAEGQAKNRRVTILLKAKAK